jgi:MFS family permease
MVFSTISPSLFTCVRPSCVTNKLGFSWVLDGLEIQIVASAGFAAEFNLTAQEVGLLGTVYLFGQIASTILTRRADGSAGRRSDPSQCETCAWFVYSSKKYPVAGSIALRKSRMAATWWSKLRGSAPPDVLKP